MSGKLSYTIAQINSAVEKYLTAFHPTTGHKHTGDIGDAPKIGPNGLEEDYYTQEFIDSNFAQLSKAIQFQGNMPSTSNDIYSYYELSLLDLGFYKNLTSYHKLKLSIPDRGYSNGNLFVYETIVSTGIVKVLNFVDVNGLSTYAYYNKLFVQDEPAVLVWKDAREFAVEEAQNFSDGGGIDLALKDKVSKTDLSSDLDSDSETKAATSKGLKIVNDKIDNYEVPDESITPVKTSFILPNEQNLFNPEKATDGYRLNTNGAPYEDALYTLSDFIPVENGKSYIFFTRNSSEYTSRVSGYSTNKTYLKEVDNLCTYGEIKTIDFDGFIRVGITLTQKAFLQIVESTVWNGNFTPYSQKMGESVKSVPLDNSIKNAMIENGAITPNKTDFISYGKNILNPATRFLGYFLNTNGTLAVNAAYDTFDYTPMVKGQSYAISKCRAVAVYNSNKSFVTRYDINPSNTRVVVATFNGFLRVSFALADVPTAQIEVGETQTSYEPYQLKVPNLSLNGAKTTDGSIPTRKLTVVKSGADISITSLFDSKNLTINCRTKGGNNTFNFMSTAHGTDLIHQNTDDITPIRTFTTVGANHGYTSIVRITMAGHGKTTADLGSKWTDGVTVYVLLDIIDNDLVFGCPYTVSNDIVSAPRVNPVATLTHVSGGTNTDDVNISTIVSSSQLYPSINKYSLKYMLDGAEIVADGTYYGDELQVQEAYNVMCYKEILDFAENNIGQSFKNDSIGGAVRLAINYVFGEKGTVTIHHNFRALKKLSVADCGFIQALSLTFGGQKLYRYLPNVSAKSGVNFGIPVDMTSYNQNIIFENADYINPEIPPNRHIDWLRNSTTGVPKVGFAMGYLIDKSNGKNADRVINTPRGWDMRDTKKSYPVAMSGLTLNAGDYKNFICYRNYLSPEWKPSATDFYVVKDKKDTYVYIDYHQSVSFDNIKLDEHVGKTITVVEKSADFTVHNDIVDADGVIFSVANDYGYAILKLS